VSALDIQSLMNIFGYNEGKRKTKRGSIKTQNLWHT